MSRPFDVEVFRRAQRERGASWGDPISVVQQTESTNDDALRAAKEGAPHGAVYLAEQQTRGRGRRGNGWFSAPGEALTFSVLLRPELIAAELGGVTLALGLGVRDALVARSPAPIQLKWPNDVLIAGKKLAGLLVETQVRAAQVEAVVVGLGLNVTCREFPPELRPTATSLQLGGASDLEREPLLADLLAGMSRRFDSYLSSGLAPMLDELRREDALAGCHVRVDGVVGIARGIDDRGALLIERASDGEIVPVLAGTVERL